MDILQHHIYPHPGALSQSRALPAALDVARPMQKPQVKVKTEQMPKAQHQDPAGTSSCSLVLIPCHQHSQHCPTQVPALKLIFAPSLQSLHTDGPQQGCEGSCHVLSSLCLFPRSGVTGFSSGKTIVAYSVCSAGQVSGGTWLRGSFWNSSTP